MKLQKNSFLSNYHSSRYRAFANLFAANSSSLLFIFFVLGQILNTTFRLLSALNVSQMDYLFVCHELTAQLLMTSGGCEATPHRVVPGAVTNCFDETFRDGKSKCSIASCDEFCCLLLFRLKSYHLKGRDPSWQLPHSWCLSRRCHGNRTGRRACPLSPQVFSNRDRL